MQPVEPPEDVPPVDGGSPLLDYAPPSPVGHIPRGLVGTTASILAFKLLSTAAIVVVGVVTARQLQPSGRGVFVLLIATASFGLLISSLGVNVSARILLVAKVDPVSSGDYLGLSAALVLLQTFVCAALGLLLLPAVNVRLSVPVLVLFAFLGAALLAQYLLNDTLNAFGYTTQATTVEAAGSVLQVLLVLLLAAFGHRSVTPFIAALLVANTTQALLGLYVLRRVAIDVRPRYRRSSWLLLLRKGLPGIPTSLGQLLTFRIDRYLVGIFLDPAAVGVYSVAATAPELLRLPSLAMGQPILYRLASGSAGVGEFRRIRNLCLVATVALAGVVAAAAPIGVRILFGPEYLEAVTPLRLLLLGELGIAVFYLDGAALAGTNRLKALAAAAMVGLGAVTFLDLLLIPAFGLAGAAVASAVAYSVMGGAAALLVRRSPT